MSKVNAVGSPELAAAVPFSVKAPTRSTIDRGRAVFETLKADGVIGLRGDCLVVEWAGSWETIEAGHESFRTHAEAIPAARIEIPVGRVTEFRLRGRWWHPRLELATSVPGTLGPGLPGGRVVLNLHRRDRRAAAELVADVDLARADAALLAAQVPRQE